ncbi:hypothetical protein [Zhengella mangrovi]|uniref:hypothetical protein n=1 Tax=Zhengella mangrovi TaxID=1982044 RepID=UPI001055A997|nr:hypothetical protein [Zhengella mangrovi]
MSVDQSIEIKNKIVIATGFPKKPAEKMQLVRIIFFEPGGTKSLLEQLRDRWRCMFKQSAS